MSEHLIAHLASIKGIDPHYTDAWGHQTQASPATVARILAAMGANTAPEQLTAEINSAKKANWLAGLAPVILAYDGAGVTLELKLPVERAAQTLRYEIKTESGQTFKGRFIPADGKLLATEQFGGQALHAYSIVLNLDLELGYHDLKLFAPRARKAFASSRLIVAPRTCYTPAAIAEGKRIWGVSVQLYGVRSQANWGIGDFTDLKQLLGQIKAQGGDFVGLNPIHSLYPLMPNSASPYSPSSRQWLNVIYIDVAAVPEFNASAAAQALFSSVAFQEKLSHARAVDEVDYTLVHELKLSALKLAYNDFKQVSNKRMRAFNQFVTEKGDALMQQAVFDALHEAQLKQDPNAWGWPAWPPALQDYHSPEVTQWHQAHQDEVLFWAYLQWLADEQLAQADQHAKALGMEIGIYRDLAVGVASGGSEIWANKNDYCTQATVGAPPDVLGPLGQNWGLPPLHPSRLAENQFAAYIKLLRANMQACGALRIDHVMALLRLWWVPAGESAANGVYVYYPVEIMLAILALESQRHRCLVIGEDLGTVPDGMDALLKNAGVYSYRVFCFETAADGGYISPAHYPEQAMATVTTHDMPTLKGYWHCDDLTLGKTLGLYPTQELVEQLTAERHQSKQLMLDSLFGHQSLPDHISACVDYVGMDRDLSFGIQQHAAHAKSLLLSLQLEDFLEMEKPVNIPGTSDEYPNWRRKLVCDLDDIFSQSHIQQLCNNISEARSRAAE
ncbi:4-alpha-glucanotransferase [Motilimonas cestriensis]|uniref:4-alpha-glucanotransferase n=1 Tax=Motilimonas cestriensis TaxID=2742685 RepID=A0ABS8WAT0_9GAMM|nr:4-alpha-glucanotransferase [Motilimonas cestriensis]MCE2596146.1 4-alpha-glucanotransferase [Motilimonas cestriensis]